MTTILVIEDTDDIRNMIEMALKMKKYDVITAKNGSEGVRIAEEHRPDLIICDVMMPLLNGYEVFKRLSDTGIVPRTPFVFATALDRPADVRYGMVLGADDYITKPFEIRDLQDSVADVLKRRDDLDAVEEQDDIENDIFLSYSHENTDLMHRVRDALQEEGFSVWCDEEIEPGRDWATALAEMITYSHCVVCILSGHSAHSKWVGRELGYAEINETPIFPILLQGDPNNSVPLRLVNHQFVDGRHEFDEAIQRLVASIRDNLPDALEE